MRFPINLSRATCFSKLNAKDGFWTIHLDEKSLYLTTSNMHHDRYHFLHMPFSLKMSKDIFQMQMDQATDCLPSIIALHVYSVIPWGAWPAPVASDEDHHRTWHHLQQCHMSYQAASDCLLYIITRNEGVRPSIFRKKNPCNDLQCVNL